MISAEKIERARRRMVLSGWLTGVEQLVAGVALWAQLTAKPTVAVAAIVLVLVLLTVTGDATRRAVLNLPEYRR